MRKQEKQDPEDVLLHELRKRAQLHEEVEHTTGGGPCPACLQEQFLEEEDK